MPVCALIETWDTTVSAIRLGTVTSPVKVAPVSIAAPAEVTFAVSVTSARASIPESFEMSPAVVNLFVVAESEISSASRTTAPVWVFTLSTRLTSAPASIPASFEMSPAVVNLFVVAASEMSSASRTTAPV